jgi:hypothetical protein
MSGPRAVLLSLSVGLGTAVTLTVVNLLARPAICVQQPICTPAPPGQECGPIPKPVKAL